ncbi:hypothetical protein M758_UG218000 [Ceratodon purpureus]|nr:hypothetical protein M758_UG218000 [Ceratodon purpureus]
MWVNLWIESESFHQIFLEEAAKDSLTAIWFTGTSWRENSIEVGYVAHLYGCTICSW